MMQRILKILHDSIFRCILLFFGNFCWHPVRVFFLRFFGVAVGERSTLGDSIFFGGGDICIGRDTHIGCFVFFDGSDSICLGDSVVVGSYVSFLTGSHVYDSNVIRLGRDCVDFSKPIVVRDRVVIGDSSILLPGVEICSGVTLHPGSVVCTSILIPGVYGGLPARLINDL